MVKISGHYFFLTACLAWLSAVQGFRPLVSLFPSTTKDAAVDADYFDKWRTVCAKGLLVGCLAFPSMAAAVSGGGLDYANIDITGQDFSNAAKAYKGKDFTQVIAKGTNFMNSNLQGCRFYKAYLVNADFSGADLRGAALEDTSMDGASLKGTVAAGAYFSASLLDVESLEDADFTDASIPLKTIPQVCARPDAKGTNPVTGVDTAESLMCP